MLGATSSSADTDVESHLEQLGFPLPSTSQNYKCTSCQISFQNGPDQRTHMKTPWHVYNIKRRIASLPPVSLDTFDNKIEKKIEPDQTTTSSRSSSSSDDEASENEGEQNPSPFQCLFCSQSFVNDNAGFAKNLIHMHTIHGMFVPNPESIIDMQSFVAYLAIEVRTWHECLYCGATKDSASSIQNHMRDKGHCLLNFDREPELLDFWENPPSVEQKSSTSLSATEIRFDSGKLIGSRHTTPVVKKALRKQLTGSNMNALSSRSEDTESFPLPNGLRPNSSRQLARREEMSIVGLSGQERQALLLAEKKAQRSEAVARRAREWVYAKGANSQKFDQLDNQRKWGKQNHKLLPR